MAEFEAVIGFEDFIRRAFARTKQPRFGAMQQVSVTDGGDGLIVDLDGTGSGSSFWFDIFP